MDPPSRTSRALKIPQRKSQTGTMVLVWGFFWSLFSSGAPIKPAVGPRALPERESAAQNPPAQWAEPAKRKTIDFLPTENSPQKPLQAQQGRQTAPAPLLEELRGPPLPSRPCAAQTLAPAPTRRPRIRKARARADRNPEGRRSLSRARRAPSPPSAPGPPNHGSSTHFEPNHGSHHGFQLLPGGTVLRDGALINPLSRAPAASAPAAFHGALGARSPPEETTEACGPA